MARTNPKKLWAYVKNKTSLNIGDIKTCINNKQVTDDAEKSFSLLQLLLKCIYPGRQ